MSAAEQASQEVSIREVLRNPGTRVAVFWRMVWMNGKERVDGDWLPTHNLWDLKSLYHPLLVVFHYDSRDTVAHHRRYVNSRCGMEFGVRVDGAEEEEIVCLSREDIRFIFSRAKHPSGRTTFFPENMLRQMKLQ